jgi:3-oxoisoapionate decarboxylase
MAAMSQVKAGVCAYGFPVGCGFLHRGEPPATRLDAYGLRALALEWGLAGVELPLDRMLPDLSPATIDRFRAELEEAGLGLVVDTGIVDVATLRETLPLAARAGARVVRATLSGILEGARATLPGGWDAHLAEIQRRIAAVLPLLAEYDLTLALENHQDATSADLLALCEAGEGRVGVTFDIANPLAVGEGPLEFARAVGPYIRNVHIKDYTIHPTPSGFRLVRAAIGEGALPWPALLALLDELAPGAPRQIELAALYARHVRLLEDDWWQGYPPRDAREILPALRLAAQHARPADEPWQTPWEAEAPDADVARYERDQFARSVAYLRSIGYA